jgi:hypothetical protein
MKDGGKNLLTLYLERRVGGGADVGEDKAAQGRRLIRLEAGLAIKNPPQKTHPKKPTQKNHLKKPAKNGFWVFFKF